MNRYRGTWTGFLIIVVLILAILWFLGVHVRIG